MVGIEKARKIKEEQIVPSINARYTTADGKVVKAVFNEILRQELEGVTKGTTCALWSKSSIEFINVYNGGMAGSGKIASLRKDDNQLLAELVTEDNDVCMHVTEVGDAYYECEITVSRIPKIEDFIPNHPVNFDDIDDDIYRCFICHKSICGYLGTHEQLELVAKEIARICESKGGRYYKSKAKGAKFAVIFSPNNHSIDTVHSLQQIGYKVTTFDKALKYFSIEHMWDISNYLDYKESTKQFVKYIID